MEKETPSIIARYPEDRPLEADEGSWWVLHAKPNCEKMMAAYLLNRGIGYYLPIVRKTVKYGNLGRTRIEETPLFRGYLCFALDRKRHNLLYDSKKFVRIIKVEDQAGFVRQMAAVSKMIETTEDLLVRPGLVPGKRVAILSGPMAGTEGVLLHYKSGKHLAVSVEMFNQTVMVRLDPLTDLEPLERT